MIPLDVPEGTTVYRVMFGEVYEEKISTHRGDTHISLVGWGIIPRSRCYMTREEAEAQALIENVHDS